MRVLVAGRNAKVLAKAAGTFANDLQIHTAATKAACLALLQRTEFDLIVACETLGDGSGLEVLSHAAVNTPNALRIFAARPSTLKLLQGELGLFGLFRTLPYPINFRKVWAAINLARSCCAETEPGAQAPAPGVRQVVLESGCQTGEVVGEVRQGGATQVPRPAAGVAARRVANAAAVAARAGAGANRSSVPGAGDAAATRTRAAVSSDAAAHAAAPSRQAQEPRRAAQACATPTAQHTAN